MDELPAGEAAAEPAGGRRRNPWWIPPFLGRVPPGIDDARLRLLSLVGLALFFEQYDFSLLTAALKHIAADLGMAEAQLGFYLSVVRLGSVAAFLMVPLADRFGRRRLFLVSVLGTGLGTLATAFTQTPWQFVAAQMATRTFLAAGQAVAFVMVAEEFPAVHRGWGTGILAALGNFGIGLGALVFAAVEILPFGWRALYAIGTVPLLLLPMMRRGISETLRFERHRALRGELEARHGAAWGWLRTLAALARTYPGRAALIAGVAGLDALGKVGVFQFTGYHVLSTLGWQPWHYSTLVILGGTIGITGNVIAGRLADRFGRQRVGFTVMALFPPSAALFYLGPGWGVPVAWIGIAFLATAGTVIQRALAAELFPTSHRGTAVGWLTLVETLTAAVGLGLVGAGSQEPGDLAVTTSLLSGAVLAGGLLLFFLPETHRRELEQISEEREEV